MTTLHPGDEILWNSGAHGGYRSRIRQIGSRFAQFENFGRTSRDNKRRLPRRLIAYVTTHAEVTRCPHAPRGAIR